MLFCITGFVGQNNAWIGVCCAGPDIELMEGARRASG